MNRKISVQNLEGPWHGPANTGLVQRCKEAWSTPFQDLSDLMVATFLSQKIGLPHMLVEAEYRLSALARDDSELFDGQLEEALAKARRLIEP